MGYAGADIAVFGEDEDLIMLVEVTAKDNTSLDLAVQTRDEALRDRRRVPEFFLVVARDAMYFWKDSKPLGSKPDMVASTATILAKYLQSIERTVSQMRRDPLEFVVGIWLQDLTNGTAPSESIIDLARLGLPEAVANGRIRFLAVA